MDVPEYLKTISDQIMTASIREAIQIELSMHRKRSAISCSTYRNSSRVIPDLPIQTLHKQMEQDLFPKCLIGCGCDACEWNFDSLRCDVFRAYVYPISMETN